jgi:hypothetical protein
VKRVTTALAVMAIAVAGATAARADDGPGSGFQSFGLSAVASGQRILADTIAGQAAGTADTGVPESEASMTSSTGHALASVAWPSALAGNAGSLLALLGPFPCTPAQIPIQPICSPIPIPAGVQALYPYLNDPIRAEAQYPVHPSDDASLPGLTMTARTQSSEVAADALIGGALASGLERIGTTRATSTLRVTGPATAVADARSTIADIDLLAGQLTVGSITSTAHAETNGTVAKSSGVTTIHDMKIAGIPVTVDDKGVHVSGNVADVLSPAVAAVNQVLANFGAKLFVTKPTQTVKGAATTFDAGSLILNFFPPGAPGGVVFVFGGAAVTAGATLPYEVPADVLSGQVPATPDLGGLSGGPTSLGGETTPIATGGNSIAPITVEPANQSAPLPGGLDAWWVILGLLAAGAAAVVLTGIPRRLFDAAGAACETGEIP